MSWWIPVTAIVGLCLYAAVCIAVQIVAEADRRVKCIPEVNVLLAACIDYRQLLIRASVPDSVSGRSGGVDTMCRRLGIDLPHRSLYGEDPRQ